MSQENVETVRQMVELFNAGDQRAISSFHEDVQFTSGFTEGRTYHGPDGMHEYASDLNATWENWHSEDDRFVAASDERVVCGCTRSWAKGGEAESLSLRQSRSSGPCVTV